MKFKTQETWWLLFFIVVVLVAESCRTLCDPMDCSPPGFSVHGILQARILEWVAISFSRVSSWPRDWTRVSCIAGWFFTTEPPGSYFSDLVEKCVEVWASAARSVDKIKWHDLWWGFVTHLIVIITKKMTPPKALSELQISCVVLADKWVEAGSVSKHCLLGYSESTQTTGNFYTTAPERQKWHRILSCFRLGTVQKKKISTNVPPLSLSETM